MDSYIVHDMFCQMLSSSISQPLRWLFLDLNSFFASVEQQERPHLRGRPVIVVPVNSPATCAIAASIEAKRFGIRTGTNVGEARKMCPDLVIVLAEHGRYVEYHERIVNEVWNHLPVTKICSIDEMACSLIGDERTPKTATRIAEEMKRGILRNVGECLTCSVGLAPSRLLAKIASDMHKPDGLVIIRQEDVEARLFGLELTDLPGIAGNRARRLAAHGINSIEQFWHLTPARARRVWGSIEGEHFWYGLHGIDPPEIATTRGSIGHSHVMGPAWREPAVARLVIRRLLIKAASRMRRLRFHARYLGVSVTLEDKDHWMRRWSNDIALPGARDDNFALLQALDTLWEMRMRQQGSGRIKKTGVVLSGLVANDALVPDLFGMTAAAGTNPRHSAVSHAMDRLNQRYGRNTVSIGSQPPALPRDTGTKIAFTRIPERVEFNE
jgi:DNA polymerase-4